MRLTWKAREYGAFEALKMAVCTTPVLMVADYERQFEVDTDASDFDVGAVLSQYDAEGRIRQRETR